MRLSLKDVSVCLAIPVNRDFPWQTTRALMKTEGILVAHGVRHTTQFLTNGSNIDKVRSSLIHECMKTGMSHIFMLDSDMSWEPEDFVRLLGIGSKLAVVGATYPAKRGPGIEFLMDLEPGDLRANEFGCLPVNGMGLGFTVCQREVFEVLAKTAPIVHDDDGSDIPMIFRCETSEGVYRSEDMVFFRDCRKAGFDCWVDPTIFMGHVGGYEYRGALKEALKKVA